jgi:hypothetical protein
MHTYSRNEDFAAQQRGRAACQVSAWLCLGSWQVGSAASLIAFGQTPYMRHAQRWRHPLFVMSAQKNRRMNTYA